MAMYDPEPPFGPPDSDPGRGESGATPGTGVLTADPTNRFSGMFWVRSDLSEFRVDLGGVVYKVALVAA